MLFCSGRFVVKSCTRTAIMQGVVMQCLCNVYALAVVRQRLSKASELISVSELSYSVFLTTVDKIILMATAIKSPAGCS